MHAADVPTKFQIPFGASAGAGFIRPIPQASQIGITPGAASLTDGFPPVNFSPVGAGGVPPFGQDMNGILNEITLWNRWQSGGGPVVFDAVFAAAVGGYPLGAMLASATVPGLAWSSIIDGNTNDPDATGTGWVPFSGAVRPSRILSTPGLTFNIHTYDYAIGIYVGGGTSMIGNLPSGAAVGQSFVVEDLLGTFSQSPITIFPPVGQTLAGAANFVCNVDGQSVSFRYYGSTVWSCKS